ncbi:MAG: FecR domain-containing protein [Chloroflexi bacterium]|nr:FecR domain-containing protein [Chloroflexota bacterium]
MHKLSRIPARMNRYLLASLCHATAALFFISLAGCSPVSLSPSTSQPVESPIWIYSQGGQTCFQLPDGSQVFLDPYTQVKINKAVGVTAGAISNELFLFKGRISIRSLLPAGQWFIVFSPEGFIGQVERTTEALLELSYDPVARSFMVACGQGNCLLGTNASNLTLLALQTLNGFDGAGNQIGWVPTVATPPPADCLEIPAATPTPAPSETPTPDLPGTATAACQQFESQFPGTPCP